MQNALSKIVCFLHGFGPCVGSVCESILEQISTDFGDVFGSILEQISADFG